MSAPLTAGPASPRLPEKVLRALYQHAEREAPRECCGVLYAAPERAPPWRIAVARNIQDELHASAPQQFPRDARTAFHLDAESLFALVRSLHSAAPARLVYHSHLEVGAYFSAIDQAAARVGDAPLYPLEHLVLDVRAGRALGAAQFAWHAGSARYREVRRYVAP